MRVKSRSFVIQAGAKRNPDLDGFLKTLKRSALVSTHTFSMLEGRMGVVVVYEEQTPTTTGTTSPGMPGVVTTAPEDGGKIALASSASDTETWILFDEEIDREAIDDDHITILENGSSVTPTITVSESGYMLRLTGAFTTAKAAYQVMVSSNLPFRGGRTLGREHILSFETKP